MTSATEPPEPLVGGQEYEITVRGRWRDDPAMSNGFVVLLRETPAHINYLHPDIIIRYRPINERAHAEGKSAVPQADEPDSGQLFAKAVYELARDNSPENRVAVLNLYDAIAMRNSELESRLNTTTAEVEWLKEELAQYDLGAWEDEKLKEWLPGAAEAELIARLDSRSENWEHEARTAQAEVAALRSQWAEMEEIVGGHGWNQWATPPANGQQVRAYALVKGTYDEDEEVLVLAPTGSLAVAWWQPEPAGEPNEQ